MLNKTTYNEDITRRGFLGGAVTAVAGVATLAAGASAQPMPKALDDRNVAGEKVTLPSGTDTIDGFLARPKRGEHRPGVVMVPGIFEVSEYMRETAAELAQNGFAALAVNYFARTPEMANTQDFQKLIGFVDRMPDRQIIGDVEAAIDYLQHRAFAQSSGVGLVGFCMGGKDALLTAAQSKGVAAAVSFYGPLIQKRATRLRPAAPLDVAKKIRVPVQGHYAGGDTGIPVADVQEFEAALQAAGTPEAFFIYPGAPHAFHDYSRPSYRAQPAKQAWDRTLEFFKQHVPAMK